MTCQEKAEERVGTIPIAQIRNSCLNPEGKLMGWLVCTRNDAKHARNGARLLGRPLKKACLQAHTSTSVDNGFFWNLSGNKLSYQNFTVTLNSNFAILKPEIPSPPKISETDWRNIKCVVLLDSYDPPESIGSKKVQTYLVWRHSDVINDVMSKTRKSPKIAKIMVFRYFFAIF